MTISSVLITGANVGLGYEAARQIALNGATRVILACRNPDKAEAAKKDLETSTGKNVFEVLVMDVANLESVEKAVATLEGGPIDGAILNAGGWGGREFAKMTDYGVPTIMAVNVLGHVHLIDLLLKQNKLSADASIVYSGSEAARGYPAFGFQKPNVDGTVEQFSSICDSSYFGDNKTIESMYGVYKLLATFWVSSMARKQTAMRFLTVSPGGTTGTAAIDDSPWFKKLFFKASMAVLQVFGHMHSVDKGAKRYVDALYNADNKYKSGVFYASKEGMAATGELVDQAEYMPVLADESYQDNASTAIHKFIKQ